MTEKQANTLFLIGYAILISGAILHIRDRHSYKYFFQGKDIATKYRPKDKASE